MTANMSISKKDSSRKGMNSWKKQKTFFHQDKEITPEGG